jgi:hypothetical protein
MDRKRDKQEYSEQETQQRFEKLVRAALNTPPKPRSKEKINVKKRTSPKRKRI